MKKIFSFLLAITLCFSLTACGGEKYMSVDELASYVEVIELTTENWMDYIEVMELELVDDFGETTGNINLIVKLKDGYYAFSQDDEYENLYSVKVRLTYDWTAEWSDEFFDDSELHTDESDITLYDYKTHGYLTSIRSDNGDGLIFEREVSNIQITKVKGSICLINIPEDCWMTGKNGVQYIKVGTKEKNSTIIYDESVISYGVRSILNSSAD